MRNSGFLWAYSLLATVLAVGLAAPAPAQQLPSDPERFHIYLLAGQSNMAGRGVVEAQDSVVHPRVWMLNQDLDWVPAVDPMHFDKPTAGVGPGRSFGLAMAEADPTVHIGLVPTAVGGSSISAWIPGEIHLETGAYPWDDAIVRARAAMQRGELKGILWHQGESDSGSAASARHADDLTTLIARFRRELDAPALPFVVGQLGRFAGRPWGDGQMRVDAAHRSVASQVASVAYVSSQGLADNGDNVHFSNAAARELGLRYARGYRSLAAASGAETSAGALEPTTLREAYKGAFLIGAAIANPVINQSDAAATEIVTRHFNSITAENVLKPQPLNPQPGVFNWGPADRFVEFGEANGMFIVGHTLVWHNQTPGWFFTDADGNPNTREAQIERLRSHIEAVAGRYAGRIGGWDVVNEIFTEDGEYRSSPWTDIIGGEELVKLAFRFADQYAPGTELYYNEYNAWRPSKRDGMLRLVRMLQEEGIRIDGVGLQGHWGLYYPRTDFLEAAIDSFAALGMKVMITELDVDVLPVSSYGQLVAGVMNNPQFQHVELKAFLDPYTEGLPDGVQRELTERYRELFEILYDRRDKIDRVTFWGVHDGTSWKNGSPVPGRTNHPLLFDRERQPKPALDAVLTVPRH